MLSGQPLPSRAPCCGHCTPCPASNQHPLPCAQVGRLAIAASMGSHCRAVLEPSCPVHVPHGPHLLRSISNKRDWERERNILSLTCVATYKGNGGFHTLLEHISPLYWFQEKEKWGILWRYYKENILRFKAPHHKIEGTDRPISTLLLVRHHGPWSSARVASGLWWGDLKAWKL
jgi:hypothetical protein